MLHISIFLALLAFFFSVVSSHPKKSGELNTETSTIVTLFATGKSSKTPIKNSPVTASDRGFYINRPTVAFACPASAHCDFPLNVTAVIVHRNTTANLASAGAVNQIFVNGSNGALTYNPTYGSNITTVQFNTSTNIVQDPGRSSNHTTSNSSDIAAGFTASPATKSGPGKFDFAGVANGMNYTHYSQFWACPNGEENPVDVYRVFVGDDRLGNRCFGIEILTRTLAGVRAAAWGY